MMTKPEIAHKVQDILIHSFDIDPDQFSWKKSLEEQQQDFKILSYLVFLEQLIRQTFGEGISILEEISTSFHTPEDVVDLIMRTQ